MGIILNGVPYYNVVGNPEFEDSTTIGKDSFLNTNPLLDSGIWSKDALQVTYNIRCTSEQKYNLKLLIKNASLVNLTDEQYAINNDVWCEDLVADYQGDVDWSYPWLITLTMIIVPN